MLHRNPLLFLRRGLDYKPLVQSDLTATGGRVSGGAGAGGGRQGRASRPPRRKNGVLRILRAEAARKTAVLCEKAAASAAGGPWRADFGPRRRGDRRAV